MRRVAYNDTLISAALTPMLDVRRTMRGASRCFWREGTALRGVHTMFSTRFSTEAVNGARLIRGELT
jgi:hypothetical protein